MLSPLIASVINLGGIPVTQELVARGANVNQAIPDLLQTPLQCVLACEVVISVCRLAHSSPAHAAAMRAIATTQRRSRSSSRTVLTCTHSTTWNEVLCTGQQ